MNAKKIATLTIFIFLVFIMIDLSQIDTIYAQYFGRNKIQYEDFDFDYIETENFKVYHYPAEKTAASDAARMVERWYTRFSNIFAHDIKNMQPLILYANHADFQQTNVIPGIIQQGVGGVTEGLKNRVVIPLTGNYAENNHVIGHELVHAFQYDIMKTRGGISQSARLPLWLVEGMSEYLSLGRQDALTAMWMRDAVLYEDLPSMSQLIRNREYFPYRFGHAVWAYIAGKWGDMAVPELFRAILTQGWNKGFREVLGATPDSVAIEWKNATIARFGPEIEGKTRPGDIGKAIVKDDNGTNLSPVISPDGRYIALLSQRDLFSIDLYLVDAQTGEFIDELVSSNTDAHFDALRFMSSAGAWSPDSKKFAFVVFENGDNRVAILDIESGDIENELKIAELDDIKHLAWAPDGDRIAMTGTSGGISDLYIYNLDQNNFEQLTDDRYFEMQPAWSPDGETLAFVTHRGPGTDFEELIFEPVSIALMDMTDGSVERIAISDEAKHINPQFSADGNDLYFVADPDGFSDLYRYSFADQSFYRLTNYATGISGLTELSPAMSLSQEAGMAVYSVFENKNYYIYGLDINANPGVAYQAEPGQLAANTDLPPRTMDSYVSEYLAEEQHGLPDGDGFSIADYDPSLGLLYAGRPVIGATVDRFGTSLGGSINLIFSDLLGNHWLTVAAQVNGGFKDLGAQVVYQNRDNRLNWGGAVGHIPYLTARFFTGTDTVTVNGETIVANELTLIRQRVFIDRIAAQAEYPLSTNRRLEFSTGYTHVGYDTERERVLFAGGTVIEDETTDISSPKGLHLSQTSVAYVGDYSFFGFTSPITGKRFRVEVEPTFGSLTYLTVLADYRHYFFMSPLTLAFRGYHLGRYLDDADSDRLYQLFLGFETMVRGYSIGSFDVSECTSTDGSEGCAEIDRLIGSRIAVFNAELRLPLFGNQQYGLINFSSLPTELTAFFDGGVAWSQGVEPELKWAERTTERVPVFSAGVAARVNFFGYLVGQFYLAWPFQRPETTTEFGFVIAPGW